MADDLITKEDLEPFITVSDEKADGMIADAIALASKEAPCIKDGSFEGRDIAKAILRGAIIRWSNSEGGSLQQDMTTDGPFTRQKMMDTRQTRSGMFTENELADLRALCADSGESANRGGAFTINTAPDRDHKPSRWERHYWYGPYW